MQAIQEHMELYRPNREKISWKIPAFCCNDWAALNLLHLCSDLAERPPFDIVYGAPRCAWSGGRPSAINQKLNETQLRDYFEEYQRYGVTCALTLSRLMVRKSDFKDPYCNLILDLLEEYDGEAVVHDDDLAQYIRRSHPKIRTITSLNKAMSDYKDGFEGCESETSYYLNLLETYDEIVIRCEYAADDRLVMKLYDVRDRVEIIVNQFCAPECMHVYRHLKAIQDWNDGGQLGHCQQCYHLENLSSMENRLKLNLYMSNSRIAELTDMGFGKMKLAGRNLPLPQFFDMISHYIFEPTGAISIIGNELIKNYRIKTAALNQQIQQYDLPSRGK